MYNVPLVKSTSLSFNWMASDMCIPFLQSKTTNTLSVGLLAAPINRVTCLFELSTKTMSVILSRCLPASVFQSGIIRPISKCSADHPNNHKPPPIFWKTMAFGGDEWVLKLMGTEERTSCSSLLFWKILLNRSTHRSMPMITTREGRNVWISGDGVESYSLRNTECRDFDEFLLLRS